MSAESRGKAPLWASLTATFFNIGYMRPGPGTWGSAATVLCWWALSHVVPANLAVGGARHRYLRSFDRDSRRNPSLPRFCFERSAIRGDR